MYLDLASSVKLASSIKEASSSLSKTSVVLAPSPTYLGQVSSALKDSHNVRLASQNLYFEEAGAFTGETSVKALKDFNCSITLLGHSERRHIFSESEEIIRKKLSFCLKNEISVILCVGESQEERDSNKTEEVLSRQLEFAKENLESFGKDLIIAYEPVWAIGTGKTAKIEDIKNSHEFVLNFLDKDLPVLYGGSVKPDNLKSILEVESVSGVLVGSASVKSEQFLEMIQISEKL